jgi:chorismate mutase
VQTTIDANKIDKQFDAKQKLMQTIINHAHKHPERFTAVD